MSELNLPPFYVGQRVVAIKDCKTHIDGKEFLAARKGDVFSVVGLMFCHEWNVDIGIVKANTSSTIYMVYCDDCGHRFKGNVLWFAKTCFAPIEENFQSISLEKVLEQETKLISVN